MEQINEDPRKMKSVESVKEDPLMGQLQPLFMKYCGIEDKKDEFTIYEEDDYPSLCIEEYNDQLKI